MSTNNQAQSRPGGSDAEPMRLSGAPGGITCVGFVRFRREAEKITLNGVRTLTVFFDFRRPSGTWSGLLTLRVKGNTMWYLDATGQPEDLASFRTQLIPVLANVRL